MPHLDDGRPVTLGDDHRVRGEDLDLRLLNPGQAAIALLDSTFTAIYADGLPTAYERMWQPDFESDIVAACEHIGAHAYADIWTMETDDDEDGARWMALDGELTDLEDAGDLIWAHMLAYVDAHPEEFFLPE